MRHVMVRYTVRKDRAAENARLIGEVFAALKRTQPRGLTYSAYTLEDDVTFVHIASMIDGADNPLQRLAEFKAFTAGVKERCDIPPATTILHEIGSYSGEDTWTLNRTKDRPWHLKTAPGTSEYTMHTEEKDGAKVLVCTVGKTVLHYDARCVDDLLVMLKNHADWMELGGADEQKPAKEGTVEAWGRSPTNPKGGWYGLKKGLRGRFGVYLPPLMEALGLCELEHAAKGNRMRAVP